MNKRIIAISSAAVLLISTAGVLAHSNSSKPKFNSTGTTATSADVQPADQSSDAQTNKELTGIPATGGIAAIGVNTTPSSTVTLPATQPSSASTGNPGDSSTPPADTTPAPKPKQMTEKHIEYRDYPADTTREDAYCVYSYDDGSTSETWVGRRPKENSQRYQLQCP